MRDGRSFPANALRCLPGKSSGFWEDGRIYFANALRYLQDKCSDWDKVLGFRFWLEVRRLRDGRSFLANALRCLLGKGSGFWEDGRIYFANALRCLQDKCSDWDKQLSAMQETTSDFVLGRFLHSYEEIYKKPL